MIRVASRIGRAARPAKVGVSSWNRLAGTVDRDALDTDNQPMSTTTTATTAVVGHGGRQMQQRSLQNETFLVSRLSSPSMGVQIRYKSTDANANSTTQNVGAGDSVANANDTSFDETMEKLFQDGEKGGIDANVNGSSSTAVEQGAWFLDESNKAVDWEPVWYNLADHAVASVQSLHEVTGLHYAGSIFAVTCAVRLFVLPFAIRSMRTASRMAHMQPELNLAKSRFEAIGTPTQAQREAFANNMKAVFKKYGVNPLTPMVAPLVQMPLFISMFFGMKKMPEIYPEPMSDGGLLWFTDLTIPDPTYALPIICGVSFFATIEAGKNQMIDGNPTYGPTLLNAFRFMSIMMVPVMTTFPAAMLCYWVPNNILTFVQSTTLNNSWVKKQFGIWERPKPVPGADDQNKSIMDSMQNLVKKAKGEPTTEAEIIKRHNAEVETKKKIAQMSRNARTRRRDK